ncbi:MAG: hypothetical protein LBC60_04660 [Spirochaetaceae bacterium]|jgi:hypothetical protein|nr:hypothetical protein [Spirochaetaceae bacterium]
MKKLVLVVLWVFMVCGVVFSQNWQQELEDAKNQMEEIMDTFTRVFPDVATQQNIEPRAWIGYLIQQPYPEITKRSGKVTKELPHFTIGLLPVGFAFMKTDELNRVGRTINETDIIPIPMLPFPSISIDARIGGIKTSGVNLPFDLGFSFFSLNLGSMLGDDADLGLQWTNWGLDARYLIIKQNGAIPNVSANVGFAHWSLDLDTDIFDGELSTNTVYFGGQASYTLNFFIPYLGIKMMTGKNKGIITLTSDDPNAAALAPELKSQTVGSDKTFFNMQFYGGFGLDWLVFQTSIGASINVFTGTPGINFSTRFSL